jgi:hypothetical protein
LIAWSAGVGQATSTEPTLDDVLRSLDAAATAARLDVSNPTARHRLDSLSSVLRHDARTFTGVSNVASVIGHHAETPHVTYRVINRWERSRVDSTFRMELSTADFQRATERVIGLGNAEVVLALRNAAVPPAQISALLAPLDSLNAARRRVALKNDLTALTNFERKYGPNAPSLSLLESALNYAVQPVPPFRTSETSGPSPYEIIASYGMASLKFGATSNDETVKDGTKVVSTGRVGLRRYIFADGWGDSSLVNRYLRPGYVSAGLLTIGPTDAAATRVWGHGYRAGAFLGWGELFAGYVIDPRHRVVVGIEKQLIPGAF